MVLGIPETTIHKVETAEAIGIGTNKENITEIESEIVNKNNTKNNNKNNKLSVDFNHEKHKNKDSKNFIENDLMLLSDNPQT